MYKMRRRKSRSAPYIRASLKRSERVNNETCSEEEEDEDSKNSDISDNSLQKYHEHKKNPNNTKRRYLKTAKFEKNDPTNSQELSIRRHQMFVNFSQLQIEESFSVEYHRNLYAKFERTENVLFALQQYIDCLNLELKASYRLCSEISGLVVSDNSMKMNEDVLNLIQKLCQLQLIDGNQSMTNTILNAIQVDKDIEHCSKDFNRCKRDYYVASRNFRILFNEYNFKLPQMDLLQRQFEDILRSFQHSRYLFDKKLPYVISKRMNVLSSCFGEMKSNFERISTERSDLCLLFNYLKTSFSTENGNFIDTLNTNEPIQSTRTNIINTDSLKNIEK